MNRSRRYPLLLLTPAAALFVLLLALPLANVIEESFRTYVGGRIGSAFNAPLTLQNYTDLLHPAYLRYLADTLRIGFVATALGVALAYPVAYFVARQRSSRLRIACVAFLITMLFLNVLVRVYALALTLGPVGFGDQFSGLLGVDPNSRAYTEIMVILGLLHHNVPMSALILISAIQNVNPRLADAAQALGAGRLETHLTIIIPLSMRGVLAAFLISYTLAISAFVVPMILGKGRVLFVANLIYNRFGEVADYPSGSAISLVMLAFSLLIVYGITRGATTYWKRA